MKTCFDFARETGSRWKRRSADGVDAPESEGLSPGFVRRLKKMSSLRCRLTLLSKMSESTGASVRLRFTESVWGARCDMMAVRHVKTSSWRQCCGESMLCWAKAEGHVRGESRSPVMQSPASVPRQAGTRHGRGRSDGSHCQSPALDVMAFVVA